MRLTQYLSQAGVCSRRAASRLIAEGRVQLNQTIATPHTPFRGDEHVAVDGQPILLSEQHLYVLYNKPVGVDCNCRVDDPASILHHLSLPQRLFPVGRIDKDSRGLMLLTNDGHLCHRLLSPQYEHPKQYEVQVIPHFQHTGLTTEFKEKMEQGVMLDGRLTHPCQVTLRSPDRFKIGLTQGLNRQIRRMCRALGYQVVDLQRTHILQLSVQGLAEGEWRYLTQSEIDAIKAQVFY
ncbi:pseudouridine synthase [Nitrincola alkalisediminis]|uniref:pseudouridine synthase n=1 Tax=Nitrincola alkalisediminis TaxID=1366656 RepID=UPI00187569A0|nr:pseudouridine synthase [Nitrincola alkalisediminis]